ncbi:hypothetical protein KBY99_00540 [Cyanobium sp. Maggiore-St4-Cus]|uniref:hypothetical protein n=1 Tax=Cyanobium sp. Maggiore-St4-Cus TaxID=2823717 RepID=UPI0020CE0BFD|nr:hypothetical protein [Cyanobium sp. Maggiore-St4-Cus]MCP9787468.1 hypothetical protein [Cyanobium sp. Maggiore-St4-Cus]
MKLLHYFIGGLFLLALDQPPALSMTEQEMGKAIGLSAIVDCLIRTGKEPEKERDPMTKYFLERNNLTHAESYIKSEKGRTAVTIVSAGGFLDEKCEFKSMDKETMIRLNRILVYYAPKERKN